MANELQPPILVIITGESGAGKTTLAKRLADELRLPLVYRDGLKETLYESLGWSDVAWSQKLGAASYDLLYHVLESLLHAGVSAVVESNFNLAYASNRFCEYQEKYGFTAFQILCTANRIVIKERIRQRALSGDRHPGHVEFLRENEPSPALGTVQFGFLPLRGATYTLDTNDFGTIDYTEIIALIKSAQ
jgi:predicted kinase